MEDVHGFHILNKLGEGSFGTVYKGQCKTTKIQYAIKLIKNKFKNEYESRKLFREIRIMRKLSQFKSNSFTPKLFKIILPVNSIQIKENNQLK